MAREYASIKLSIWADDDWRALSPLARYLYMTLLTSPTLNHCGVADWRPARIGALNGMTADEVETAGDELVEGLYLVIDEESEEVLIRSFVRNDGLMKQPKMAVAVATAHASVASQGIRGVVVHELIRLQQDHPDLHGWSAERATELLGLRSVDPSTYPLGKGSTKGIRTPSAKGCPTPVPVPIPTPSNLSTSPNAAASADASPIRDDVDRICRHLAFRIVENGSKEPTIGKTWHDASRLMLDKDARPEPLVHQVIDWCQADEFWRANVLSVPTLREKFDQLRLQMSKDSNVRPLRTIGGLASDDKR